KVAAAKNEAETTGRLLVKSNRAGATVEATHSPSAGIKGTTDQVLSGLPPGKYAVTLHAEGWPDAHGEANVTAGAQTEAVINFKSGSLRLDSDPTGAAVSLAGAVLGKTPLVIPQLPVGECSLSLAYPSWPALPVKISITENGEATETVRLPHGKLTVETIPAGATVLLGGKAYSKTPLFFDPLPAGLTKLTLQAKDFPPLEVSVPVDDRGDVKVSRELGAGFPELDPSALLQAVWVPDDPNQLAPRVDSVGRYEPKNGVVKNLNRKRLYENWLRKTYRYSATIKAYDPEKGRVEFAEQAGDLSRYRIMAELSPAARNDKDLAARLAKGATVSLYGRLNAVEEPRWPLKVITFELSSAELLH
ncbi:MAG: PEGA domain-containing protein, partial [bacterium]|nr:PEGA domain-containing protein [bacterium]